MHKVHIHHPLANVNTELCTNTFLNTCVDNSWNATIGQRSPSQPQSPLINQVDSHLVRNPYQRAIQSFDQTQVDNLPSIYSLTRKTGTLSRVVKESDVKKKKSPSKSSSNDTIMLAPIYNDTSLLYTTNNLLLVTPNTHYHHHHAFGASHLDMSDCNHDSHDSKLDILDSQSNHVHSNVDSMESHDSNLDLGNSDLGRSDLGGSDLGNSDLGRSDLGGSDLGGSDLGGSDLGGSDLGGSNL